MKFKFGKLFIEIGLIPFAIHTENYKSNDNSKIKIKNNIENNSDEKNTAMGGAINIAIFEFLNQRD